VISELDPTLAILEKEHEEVSGSISSGIILAGNL
jgi:hypothetical protein